MVRFTSFSAGDLVHCIKRGAFGHNIFIDNNDYWHFVRLLYLCNDEYQDQNLCRYDKSKDLFSRPAHWPKRVPLVDVISWCAMPNHFHLLLRERQEGGIGKYMQRLGGSMTKSFNLKYSNSGSIFQAKYKPVLVTDSSYLNYLIPYINVKNVMELYPNGGLEGAVKNFDKAWEWAKSHQFSSFKTFAIGAASPILSIESLRDFDYPKKEAEFKIQALECINLNLHKDIHLSE